MLVTTRRLGGKAPRRPRLAAPLSMVAVCVLTVGCSGGGGSAGGGSASHAGGSVTAAGSASAANDLADVCAFLRQVNDAAASASSPAAGLVALKKIQTQIHDVTASAPGAVSVDLKVLSTAVDTAVRENKLDPMATDPVAAAGVSLTKKCV